MTTYTISRTDDADLQFDGELLSFVSSQSGNRAKASGRWTELAVYKTNSGKYVLVTTGKSNHKNEVDLNKVQVEDTLEALVAHLLPNRLSKSLISDLGLVVVETI